MSRFDFACFVLLVGSAPLRAQDEEKAPPEGPKVGGLIAGAFDAYNLNGKFKGRQHCPVTDFGLRPSVLIFAREVPKEKEGALPNLLSALDEAVEKLADLELRACVVYLSPFARSSATDVKVEDPAKLVEEARERAALLKRLEAKAEKLKNVLVAVYPAKGPEAYNLNPRDDATVIFYNRLKVLGVFRYAEGQMRDQDVERIMDTVQDSLKKTPRDRKGTGG